MKKIDYGNQPFPKKNYYFSVKIIKLQHQFNSLSFTTQSRIKHKIVNKNKNRDSKIDSFISIGGYKKDNEKTKQGVSKKYQIDIPTKTDQSYHLNLDDYSKIYTMQFEGNSLKRINLTIKSRKRYQQLIILFLKRLNRKPELKNYSPIKD